MKTLIFSFAAILTLGACAAGGAEGDSCTADADCADGLECHFEDHSEHEHEEGHEETGVCESHEDHSDSGHDDEDHDDEDHEDEDHEGEDHEE